MLFCLGVTLHLLHPVFMVVTCWFVLGPSGLLCVALGCADPPLNFHGGQSRHLSQGHKKS